MRGGGCSLAFPRGRSPLRGRAESPAPICLRDPSLTHGDSQDEPNFIAPGLVSVGQSLISLDPVAPVSGGETLRSG